MNSLKKILKIPANQFNLENTLVNGQCFNWKKIENDHFKGVFRNYLVTLKRINENDVEFESHPEMGQEQIDKDFLKDYLQYPEVDIPKCYEEWSAKDPKYFAKIAKPLEGVRCLRQDPWECTISFICSSNNNIKRITQLVHALRNNYGT